MAWTFTSNEIPNAPPASKSVNKIGHKIFNFAYKNTIAMERILTKMANHRIVCGSENCMHHGILVLWESISITMWTFRHIPIRTQELCESRAGRPGLPTPNSPYGLYGRKATLDEEMWWKQTCSRYSETSSLKHMEIRLVSVDLCACHVLRSGEVVEPVDRKYARNWMRHSK